MNFTSYFIKHPVTSIILNIIIIVIGYLSFNSINLREYPDIKSNKILVETIYPNASPSTIENSITIPLENKLAAVSGIDYMTSDSLYGKSYIRLNFKNGVSIDKSVSAVSEAVGLVTLPVEAMVPQVQRVNNSEELPFMIISIEDSSMNFNELTHFAKVNLKNTFSSIKGVSSADILGEPYNYNVILDVKKMYALGVNVDEVYQALKNSNIILPAGKFQDKIPVTLNSELKEISDYENLLIKSDVINKQGNERNSILLKDIAELNQMPDVKRLKINIEGIQGVCLAVQKSADANPLEISKDVNNLLDELRLSLPSSIKLKVILDQAGFINQSLKNVKNSIFEAIIFVLIIIFIFLRSFRAALIPLFTIPISLVGTFIFLKIFGYSINILTLLAMVLAIGLVVDDAIIVLENIQRHVEKGVPPLEASIKGSKEISFSIIAMTLTLVSVYAPIAFIQGITGELFTEFAVALAGSVLVSGIVALTLSPLMCSKILNNSSSHNSQKLKIFSKYIISNYKSILEKFLLYKKINLILIILSLISILFFIKILPSEISPKEDRSFVGVFIPPVIGETVEQLVTKMDFIENKIKSIPEIEQRFSLIADWGVNILLSLKPQSSRKRTVKEIFDYLYFEVLSNLPSFDAYPFALDSGLPGLDSGADSELSTMISTTDSYEKIFETIKIVRANIEKNKFFNNIRSDLKLDTPGYLVKMDLIELANLNLTPHQIAKTIEIFFSGVYCTFSKDGIEYNINLKGKNNPWSLNELYITNPQGERISLGAVAELVQTSSPNRLFHYNQMRSVNLSTNIPQGSNYGDATEKLNKEIIPNLPKNYKIIQSGKAKIYKETQQTLFTLFYLAVIFVYAILAVQFQNFIDPFIILFTVPLACVGGLFFIWLYGGSLNIYTQIGLITLVGLITKHGILIIEFTNMLSKEMPLKKAIIEACLERLRPIMMTTSAMLCGIIPLILFREAGYEARRAIGIVLLGGLTVGTLFTLFILPAICYLIKTLPFYQSNMQKD